MRDPTRERNIELPEATWLELQKRAMAGEQILEDYVQRILLDHVENSDPPSQPNLAPVPTKEMFENITYESLTAATYRIERFCSAPKGDEPWDKPFFRVHTSRMFPFVLAVKRLLAELQTREVDSIPYPEFVDIVQQTASSFKHYLIGTEAFDGPDGLYERGFTQGLPWIEYEDHLRNRHGWSRKSNTPLERRRTFALNHFRSNYLLVNPASANPGALVFMGLVGTMNVPGVSMKSRNRHVGLTRRGFSLAVASPNPLIDELDALKGTKRVKATLSEEEQSHMKHAILEFLPKEEARMRSVTRIVEALEQLTHPVKRSMVYSDYMSQGGFDEGYKSETSRSMAFSALLFRMHDLGLLMPSYGAGGRVVAWST